MKLLIVDDEKEIRDGLSYMIRHLQMEGLLPVGIDTAGDGAEALEIMATREIHLVITDIRMPRVDGLELLAAMKERHAMVQAIVLSGHEDFSKVQQALRLNAIDYLLKPVKTDELVRSLQSAQIRRERMIQHTIFSTWEAFMERAEPYRCVVAGDVDRETDSPSSDMTALQTIVAETITASGKGICCLPYNLAKPDRNKLILLGFCGSDATEIESELNDFTKKVMDRMSESADAQVSFGVSEWFRKGTEYGSSYPLQACSALAKRMFAGSGLSYYRPDPVLSVSLKNNMERIVAAFEVADRASILNGINELTEQLLLARSVDALQRGVEFILLSVVKRFHEHSERKEMITAHDISELMVKLLWSRSVDEYKQVLLNGVSECLTKLAPEDQGGQVIQRAKQYIRENFHRPIAMADVSSSVYVSPNYLSYLFREQVGMTFLEYLTGLRMQEAKKLLMQPGSKVYEVAEKVGYGSWKHFSRTFKQATAYNPIDFQKKAHS
ncbi:MAG: response regulator [Paenibacillaceae bacterium]|nr:response regulator [Paenibacillaceae bacterium]